MSRLVRGILGVASIAVSFIPGVGPITGAVLRAVGAGLASSALTPKLKPPQTSSATLGRLNTDLDPEAFRKIVYGRTAMATDARYWEVLGADQSDYHQVVALATHKITSIDAFYIDDELVTFDGSGNAIGKYAGVLSRTVSLVGVTGTIAGSVGTETRWNVSGGEAASMTGCAHIILRWKWSQEKLPQGIPTRLTIVGAGAAVYDPRRDSTRGGSGSHRVDDPATWAYSTLDSNGVPIGRNRALQTLHYLIGEHIINPVTSERVLVAGMGLDPDDIDFASFITAANDCEAEQYYGDGALSTGDAHSTNIAVLEEACAGVVSDKGGRWSMRIRLDDFTSGAPEFTDSDIVGEVDWRPEMPVAANGFNQIAGQFIDPDALYQLRPLPLVRDAAYETADGTRQRTNIRLDHVQDPDQGQKLLRIVLNKTRRSGVFEAPFGWRAVNVEVGQPIKLTLSRFGFTARWFRVRAQKVDPGGAVWMVLEDDAPEVYTGGTVLPVPPPGAGAGYDWGAVPTPSGGDWTGSGGSVGNPGFTEQPAILLGSAPLPAGVTGVWIEYAQGEAAPTDPDDWINWYKGDPARANYTVTGVDAAQPYFVSIRYANPKGVWGSDDDRLILGPLTTGGLVAGDALIPSETLDDIRERIDATKADVVEAFESLIDRFGTEGWPDTNLVNAVDGSMGVLAQAGQENLIRDPRNTQGAADQWVSDNGIVRLTADARRGALLEATSATAGEAFQLILWQGGPNEQSFEILPGARLAVSIELAGTGSAGAPFIQAQCLDADGDPVGAPIVLDTDLGGGRVGGFVEPADINPASRSIRARPTTISTGAGDLSLSAIDPYIGFASPTQTNVPAFIPVKDERIVRVRQEQVANENTGTFQFLVSARSLSAFSTAGLALSASETNATAILGVQTVINDPVTGLAETRNTAVTALEATEDNATAITGVQTVINDPTTGLANTYSIATTALSTADGIATALTSAGITIGEVSASASLFLQSFVVPMSDPPELRTVFAIELDNDDAIVGLYGVNDQASKGFVVRADTFEIKGATTDITPFSVDGDTVRMLNIEVDTIAANSITADQVVSNSIARTYRFDGSAFGEQSTTSSGIVLGFVDNITLRGGAIDVLVQARMGISSPTGSGLLRVRFIIVEDNGSGSTVYTKDLDITASFTGSRDLDYRTIGFSVPAASVPTGDDYFLGAALIRTHSAGTLAIKDHQLRVTEDASQT